MSSLKVEISRLSQTFEIKSPILRLSQNLSLIKVENLTSYFFSWSYYASVKPSRQKHQLKIIIHIIPKINYLYLRKML
jgi:hypothetical protein